MYASEAPMSLYFGFGGGLGLGTPVVSYAPLPMLQTAEDCGKSIIFGVLYESQNQVVKDQTPRLYRRRNIRGRHRS